jgi:hypothetical protein
MAFRVVVQRSGGWLLLLVVIKLGKGMQSLFSESLMTVFDSLHRSCDDYPLSEVYATFREVTGWDYADRFVHLFIHCSLLWAEVE